MFIMNMNCKIYFHVYKRISGIRVTIWYLLKQVLRYPDRKLLKIVPADVIVPGSIKPSAVRGHPAKRALSAMRKHVG